MKPKFRSLIAAFAPLSRNSLIVCASLCATAKVNAAKTWSGATDATWAALTNWVEGALPGTTETVVFDSNSTANLTAIALGANRTVKGISLSSPASDVTIAAGNTLTLAGGGIDMSGATANFTSNAALNLTTGQQSFDVASTKSITLASLARTTSGGIGNANVGASLNIPSTGGTVKVGTAAVPVLLDAQGNPWVTYGANSFAGTDASGFVIGATPTLWTASIGTGFFNIPYAVGANFTQSGNGGVYGIVFNDPTNAYTLTLASTTTFTGRAVLMAAGCPGGTITGGNLRPNRSASGAGGNSPMNFIQNSVAGDLRISNLSNASSSTTVSLVKSGVGKMIITGGAFHTGGTFINAGTLQVGEGGAAGTLGSPTSMIVIQSGASLITNVSADITLNGTFSGSGSLTQQGSGTTTLGGTNTAYTGAITINGGAIAATSSDNLGTGTDLNINGGALKFLGAFDPSTRDIVIGSSGATFNTNGNAITLANPFTTGSTGAVTKTGAGSLSIAGDNDYAGGTTVSAGSLLASNTSGSATGSGAVTVASGASIGGTGVIAGTVTVASGGNIAPGASVETLDVGGLVLSAGSTGTFEFNGTPANDAVIVTTSGGLTINGGAITLFQEGTASPFSVAGTYNLIGYTGAIGGTGVSSLSVANPQPGFAYSFGTSGGFVTLTITTTGVVSEWGNTGGGSWGVAGNWTNSTVPNVAEATANFFSAIASPSAVTLDGSKTVGAISFNNGTNAYTINEGTGGTLTLNNGANPSAISNNDGNHVINTPVTLTTNTSFTTAAADDSTTLGGVISGAGTVTKTGPGGLSLLGNNLMTGAVTLSGGTTTFASGGLGSGSLTISGASLVWNTANSQDISDRSITFGSSPVTFDTNGNDVSLVTSAIGGGGAAAFTKAGTGRLTFDEDPTFTGNVTISGGVLQLGTGGTTGVVFADITNNGELDVNLADGEVFANVVSGTGSFVHSGTGSLTLNAANTFSGTTSITSGSATLALTSAINIQNSTLQYAATGGALGFGTQTAVTLGGLAGDKGLALDNVTPAAVALTIGNNGLATSYSGVLSGTGSLVKIGTGVSTLTGVNTFSGSATVTTGTLELGGSGALSPSAVTVAGNATLLLSGSSSSLTTTGLCNVSNTGTVFPVLRVADGSATLADIHALGNANNGYRLQVEAGTLSATNVRLGRGSLSFLTEAAAVGSTTQGLYLTGGTVSISGALEMGVNALTNSSVSTLVAGGILNVAGQVTVGLNNGGRWSVLEVTGGEFNSTDVTTGLVLGGPAVGNAVFSMTNGLANVERIQFGQGILAGTSVVRLNGGELYLGAGGFQKVSPNVVSEIRLNGGTLGAKAAWSTAMPINLAGTGSSVIKAADSSNNPFAITISGAITGTGGLNKEGTGDLILSGAHSHAGITTVLEGRLEVLDKSFNDTATVSVKSGATLKLSFSGGDKIAALYINDDLVADETNPLLIGTWGGIGSGADHEDAALEGAGLLYIGVEPPTSAYATWAGTKGLTPANNGANDDPDNDGVENQLEFVLGGEPLTSSTAILPTVTPDASNFIFTFTRNDDSEAEVALKFQYGSNLTGWTPVVIGADTGSSGAGVSVAEGSPATAPDTITVTVSKTGNPILFGRLQAVKTP